eukprot:COSAG03_NODE_21332_length_305_cov_1.582524_1_plen_39_part_10
MSARQPTHSSCPYLRQTEREGGRGRGERGRMRQRDRKGQ